jgi:hypothetical protein
LETEFRIAMNHEHRFLHDCPSESTAGSNRAADANTDMATIERLAPNIFVLDLIDAGPPIYRCAGSAIQYAIGSNPQGKGFYDRWDVESQMTLKPYFDWSAESHRPFRISSIGLRTNASPLQFETVLIPVLSDDVRKRCFIGISLTLGNPGVKAKTPSNEQRVQHISFLGEELALKKSERWSNGFYER